MFFTVNDTGRIAHSYEKNIYFTSDANIEFQRVTDETIGI